jgi:hypothetical protein
MGSDNQWTAVGPAEIGFQTHGANIREGADIAGNQVGVVGRCQGPVGDGVQGFGSGTFSGLAGFGGPTAGTGVWGIGGGGGGTGVRGIGNSGPNTVPDTPVGVYGQGGSDNADGVQGIGVGRTSAGAHGLSFTVDGNGVIGEAHNGPSAYGVWGRSRSGYAGKFDGKVRIFGDLEITGQKAAIVALPYGAHVRLYAVESPESWFEDFGFGQLVGGRAEIQLDGDFSAVIDGDRYHVFITEYDDSNGLYVTNRTSRGFEVRSKTPTASGEFSYRVVARRKDVTAVRFEKVASPLEKSEYEVAMPRERAGYESTPGG